MISSCSATPAAGARGQSAARRLAGAQGSGLQRGQDARRLPRRGLRLPRIQRPPLQRQAADQAEQGGRQTDPEQAPRGDALPTREQRSRGRQKAQPDHSGLGRLLPDAGLQRHVQRAGSAPVAAHLEVGQVQPPEQAEDMGLCPVLRQVQQVQAGPLGIRRPQQRRLPPQVLLDPNPPPPARQTRRRHPTTPR